MLKIPSPSELLIGIVVVLVLLGLAIAVYKAVARRRSPGWPPFPAMATCAICDKPVFVKSLVGL